MKITLKNKIFLSAFLFLILNLILILFFIYPSWKEIQEKSEELILVKEKLLALEQEVKSIDELKKLEERLKPAKEKIESLFINKEIPLELISFLENLSQSCQVSQEILPLPKSSKKSSLTEPWPFLDFQMKLFGSFPNIARFLEKIESGPFLIKVENLNIVRLNENELAKKEFEKFKLGDVRVTFLLRAFGK